MNHWGINKQNIDSIIALVALIISFLLTILYIIFIGYNMRVLIPLLVIILFSILFLYQKRLKRVDFKIIPKINKYKYIYELTFILIFVISLLLLFIDAYERPLTYFLLITILFTMVTYEIFIFGNIKRILIKIICIALNLRIGLLLKFPVVGGDTSYWFYAVNGLLNHVNIVADHLPGDYISDYPLYAVNVATQMMISNINYNQSVISAISLPLIITVPLFIYLIGKQLFNEKVGMLAALFIIPYPFDIWYTYNIAPMTFAVLFIPMIVYFLLKSENKLYIILSIITMIVIVYSHPLVIAIMTIIILSMCIGILALSNKKKNVIYPFILCILLIASRWTFFTYNSWLQVSIDGMNSLINSILSLMSEKTVIMSNSYSGLSSIYSQILNALGPALFVGLAFIGILYVITKKYDIYRFAFMITTIILALLSLFMSTFGVGPLPYRWLGPSSYLLSIFVAIGLLYINIKYYYKLIFLFIVIFLLVTNPLSNIDNPIYGMKDTTRWAYTIQEKSAADWSYKYSNVELFVDGDYYAYYRGLPFVYNKNLNIYPEESNNTKGIFMVRDYMFERTFYGNLSTIFYAWGADSDMMYLSNNDIYGLNAVMSSTDKIYDNNNVNSYYTQNTTNVLYKIKELNLSLNK